MLETVFSAYISWLIIAACIFGVALLLQIIVNAISQGVSLIPNTDEITDAGRKLRRLLSRPPRQ